MVDNKVWKLYFYLEHITEFEDQSHQTQIRLRRSRLGLLPCMYNSCFNTLYIAAGSPGLRVIVTVRAPSLIW